MRSSGIHKILGFAGCAFLGLPFAPLLAGVSPLGTYPAVERLWMGLEEGSIRPAAYEQIRASAEGYIALHAKDGQMLKKDEHWATSDPEQLEIERKSVEIDASKLERQIKKNRDDAMEAKARTSLELHEAEGKRTGLLDAARDEQVPAALKTRVKEAITNIDEQIAQLRGKIDPETIERDLKLEADEGGVQMERKRKQLLATEKRSRLVAGFDGELRLSDPLKKLQAAAKSPDELLWVKPNEHIATLVNDQVYEISVTASSPLLAEIPTESLLVFLQEGKTGRLVAGEYARTDEIDTGAEIVRNYIFTIRKDSVDVARYSVGQRNLVHVYRKFPRPYRMIHKKDIAFLASDVLAASGWDGLVRHLWPGSEVIQVGPQTIAVKPKDEN